MMDGRIRLFALLITLALLLYLSTWFSISSCTNDDNMWTVSHQHNPDRSLDYFDMNALHTNPENDTLPHVLILTPFKDSAQFIENTYFKNIQRLTYPHHRISLGFLVSDSVDNTLETLQSQAAQLEHEFHRISIYKKDYDFKNGPGEERHSLEIQVLRRQIMAKSRNTLLSSALTEEIAWVLWLDGDVIEYPPTLLEDLIGMDKDVLVPNCFWHTYNEEDGYDKNNWQETAESWEMQKSIRPEAVLVEGYPDIVTHRKSLVSMRNKEGDPKELVPLDGVGGTCTLVKSQVHRDGAIFPVAPFQHQVETEGLAKMAKALGYEVWGLPNYVVYHYIA